MDVIDIFDEDDLPDIFNNDVRPVQKRVNLPKRSAFHVVIHPNISKDQLDRFSQNKKKQLYQMLKYYVRFLRDNLGIFILDDEDLGNRVLNIKKFRFTLERGENLGRLHADGIIIVDDNVLLDSARMQGVMNAMFRGLSNGSYVNLQKMKDNVFYAEMYSQKQIVNDGGVQLI